MISQESPSSARQPLLGLIVEDSPDDAELIAHEPRQAGFDLTWRRVDTEADYLWQLEQSPAVAPPRKTVFLHEPNTRHVPFSSRRSGRTRRTRLFGEYLQSRSTFSSLGHLLGRQVSDPDPSCY